jgi:hypothetical protein
LIIDYPGTIFAQIFAQRSSIHLKVHDFLNLVEKKEAERMVHLGVLFDSVVRFFVFVVNACVHIACVFFLGGLVVPIFETKQETYHAFFQGCGRDRYAAW